MFTDFYKKIIIPGRGYHDANSSNCSGYFWNTSLPEQTALLSGVRDIYGNYLMNYTTPAGTTGTQLYRLVTQNIYGTNVGRLYTNAFTNYYDKDNDQWVSSSGVLTNYFAVSASNDYSIQTASGIGSPTGSDSRLAPLYSDALMPTSFPSGNYGYAATDYIMIGTGNTANTSSTYQLEAPVSAADCNFSISKTINGYNITIANKKNTDLVISELGYCVCTTFSTQSIYPDSSSTTGVIKSSNIPTAWNGLHNINTFTVQGLDNAGFTRDWDNYYITYLCFNPVLCCRTVLSNPITITAGERITITWNFELDI